MDPAREILSRILAHLEAYGATVRDGREWAWSDDLPVNGVPYKPATWLGHSPTAAETKAFYRALVKLERDELLVRVVCGARTTNVQPTPAGLAAAVRGVRSRRGARGPNLADVALALTRAEWADDELRKAVK